MKPYADSVVETYCGLTGFDRAKFRAVATPHLLENSMTEEALSSEGELSSNASRILMPLLWLSRLSRPDLSFITTRLASRVASWTKFEDRQPYRCISCLNHTISLVLTGSVEHKGALQLHRRGFCRVSSFGEEYFRTLGFGHNWKLQLPGVLAAKATRKCRAKYN